jgi:predicted metal-dependent phosphoesterase TrpH
MRGGTVTRAEYHVHTSASYDSHAAPDAIVERALAAGLDVLCVTDHDTLDGAVALQARAGRALRIVVGCEFTCVDRSHVIGLGLTDAISERRVLPLLERIRLQGGAVLLPHLFRRGSGVFRSELRRGPDFVRDVLARTDVVECFNARDTFENNSRSQRFALEHRLATVAASDAHRADELGRAFVEYGDAAFVHGVSARRIFFPTQAPVLENPVKRRVMELYHRHEGQLPPAVRRAYRALRSQLRADGPGRAAGTTRLQYDLPPCDSPRPPP